MDRVHSVDVFVKRGRAYAELPREAGERGGVDTFGIGYRRGGVDHSVSTSGLPSGKVRYPSAPRL